MIGKLYVGPHERLRAAVGVLSPLQLIPARLSEIDYVHPRDIAAVMAALPPTMERWTNHPWAVDAVPADRVIVLTEAGPLRLCDYPEYATRWCSMKNGELWTAVWESGFVKV